MPCYSSGCRSHPPGSKTDVGLHPSPFRCGAKPKQTFQFRTSELTKIACPELDSGTTTKIQVQSKTNATVSHLPPGHRLRPTSKRPSDSLLLCGVTPFRSALGGVWANKNVGPGTSGSLGSPQPPLTDWSVHVLAWTADLGKRRGQAPNTFARGDLRTRLFYFFFASVSRANLFIGIAEDPFALRGLTALPGCGTHFAVPLYGLFRSSPSPCQAAADRAKNVRFAQDRLNGNKTRSSADRAKKGAVVTAGPTNPNQPR